MIETDLAQFKITSPVNISEYATRLDLQASKKEIKKDLAKTSKSLAAWQDTLYAHKRYAVLFCLQGMDTSGKDSLIREVFKGFNSRGVVVHSFKAPSPRELRHDYLWRHYVALPERGKFGVFNRTHYENVLVTRVNPEYLLHENLPGIESLDDLDEEFWRRRFAQIRNFEKHLHENGTIVLKFFLNLSKEEQRQRLLRRLRKPNKNWKFSPADMEERKLWAQYRDYYQEAINETATAKAPWFVIPADDKPTARYLVAKILWEELSQYEDVREPELSDEVRQNLDSYEEQLKKES